MQNMFNCYIAGDLRNHLHPSVLYVSADRIFFRQWIILWEGFFQREQQNIMASICKREDFVKIHIGKSGFVCVYCLFSNKV